MGRLFNVIPGKEQDYLTRQHRILLKNSGKIDPGIDSYLAAGGYQGLKVLTSREEVIATVKSGLRGRAAPASRPI